MIARSLGSPAYAHLRLFRADGGQVAESQVSDSDEEALTVTIAEDGVYRLMVEERLRHGGPDFGYRVEAESSRGFSLALKHAVGTKTQFNLPVNGGAIALGHPIGATGAMLLGTVLDELERRDMTTGLVTLCIGGGMGIATIIERL